MVWGLSALLAPVAWNEIDPRSGQPLRVENQLTGPALTRFLVDLVGTFTGFKPLGVVLVAMLGVGVAERTGLIAAGLKLFVAATPRPLLTPALLVMAIVSHSAADAGFVLVIPVAGLIFHAAGRHPLAGVAAGFAGRLGRVLGELHPVHAGSAAGRADPGRRAARRSPARGEPAVQLVLHQRLLPADRGSGLVDHRSGDRAAPARGWWWTASRRLAAIRRPGLQANERRGLLAALLSVLVMGGLLVLAAVAGGIAPAQPDRRADRRRRPADAGDRRLHLPVLRRPGRGATATPPAA